MIAIGIGLGITHRHGGGAVTPSIVLSGTRSVAEDASTGTLVGSFAVANGSGDYEFTLTGTAGGLFALDGVDDTRLEVNGALNYEAATSHEITIEADNGVDDPISRSFTIQVTNVLEVTLAALSLDTDDIDEGAAENTVVGALQNLTSGSSRSLTDTAGNRFKLSGTNIVAGPVATDYETSASHNITVRETHPDATNTPRDTILTINVVDVIPWFSLSVDFDPLVDDDIEISTDGAGTLYWSITENTTETAADIIAATGAVEDGHFDTVEGTIGFELPDLDDVTELFFHAVMCLPSTTTQNSDPDSTRVQQGADPTQAQITVLSGDPNITEYTDGDGDWKAWEWTESGSFEVTNEGEVEYELVAGGGGGGGGTPFVNHGGGGAGGVLQGTDVLPEDTYSVTVGAAGVGATTSGPSAPTNGGDTTALGLTAIGGGKGGVANPNADAGDGGSGGGGAYAGASPNGEGTDGQGYDGGLADGGGQAAGGGGGSTGAGGNGAPADGGDGGAGETSDITGTPTDIAGGGAGTAFSGSSGTATHGGGAAGSPSSWPANSPGGNATGPGGGGGAAADQANGGNGFRGRFVIRIRQD